MLPLLLLGAGVWVWHKHKTQRKQGLSTPAQAQLIHGQLMGREFNPTKLEKAAELFHNKGLTSQARDLKFKAGQVREQAKVAAELVERSRANDQNALGMIAAIREEAAKNKPRAIVSAGLIAKYIEQNPMPELGPLGEMPMR